MAKTEFDILVGNYGSGKTEISLNLALDARAEGKKTALVDLDIVNPYFRSSAHRKTLEEAGVHVIASPYANCSIDLPLVAAETVRIFTGEFDYAIVDVGGDPVGATALGRYRENFEKVKGQAKANYIINACRPQTMNVPDIAAMFALIEGSSRLKMTGFINNTNLADETTGAILYEGQDLVEDVAKELGLPVRWITGRENVIADFKALAAKAGKPYQGETRVITTRMRPEWFSF